MADVLDDRAIDAALGDLPGWTRQDSAGGGATAISRTCSFSDFAEAMAFVNRVAEVAEEMDHHPDIVISYGTVDLTVSSHSAGGVTPACITLAGRINEL